MWMAPARRPLGGHLVHPLLSTGTSLTVANQPQKPPREWPPPTQLFRSQVSSLWLAGIHFLAVSWVPGLSPRSLREHGPLLLGDSPLEACWQLQHIHNLVTMREGDERCGTIALDAPEAALLRFSKHSRALLCMNACSGTPQLPFCLLKA